MCLVLVLYRRVGRFHWKMYSRLRRRKLSAFKMWEIPSVGMLYVWWLLIQHRAQRALQAAGCTELRIRWVLISEELIYLCVTALFSRNCASLTVLEPWSSLYLWECGVSYFQFSLSLMVVGAISCKLLIYSSTFRTMSWLSLHLSWASLVVVIRFYCMKIYLKNPWLQPHMVSFFCCCFGFPPLWVTHGLLSVVSHWLLCEEVI